MLGPTLAKRFSIEVWDGPDLMDTSLCSLSAFKLLGDDVFERRMSAIAIVPDPALQLKGQTTMGADRRLPKKRMEAIDFVESIPVVSALIGANAAALNNPECRREIIGLLLDELSMTGLDPDDEPNARGLYIERIIDILGCGDT